MRLGLLILTLVFHVGAGERISDALDQAREAYKTNGETSTIYIAPGTYYEELTIDIPCLKLINESCKSKGYDAEAIEVKNGGTEIGAKAVRISWYYGHGYQYASMGPNRPNYGGSRERRWNASTLVTAPEFYAKGIIFENSFNLYVSPLEAEDTLVDLSDAPFNWTEKERPKHRMPERPKTVYSTEVQKRQYRERASALSFTNTGTNAQLHNCRIVGRQDALYGDHGASVEADSCVLCGSVDYIFGGMDFEANQCELVAMVGGEKGGKCYIAAGRGYVKENEAAKNDLVSQETIDSIPENEYALRGMIFRNCSVRYATEDELEQPGKAGISLPVYLCRPWRWWGVHVFENITAAEGVLNDEYVSLGLTKGHPAPFISIKKIKQAQGRMCNRSNKKKNKNK